VPGGETAAVTVADGEAGPDAAGVPGAEALADAVIVAVHDDVAAGEAATVAAALRDAVATGVPGPEAAAVTDDEREIDAAGVPGGEALADAVIVAVHDDVAAGEAATVAAALFDGVTPGEPEAVFEVDGEACAGELVGVSKTHDVRVTEPAAPSPVEPPT
jgi:hypothetical protein